MTPTQIRSRDLRLAGANRIRIRRSEWKREVSDLERTAALDRFAALILARPAWALTMPLESALRAVPFVGPVKVQRLMRQFLRTPRIGDLTRRERDVIIEFVQQERVWAAGRYQG